MSAAATPTIQWERLEEECGLTESDTLKHVASVTVRTEQNRNHHSVRQPESMQVQIDRVIQFDIMFVKKVFTTENK